MNVDAFIKGIKDQMADTSLIAKDSIKPIIQNRMMKIMEEKSAKKTTENKKFFSKNAQREEVKELESGLQYEVIKEGTGPKPTPKDQIMAHYHGTTLEGKVFDSSVERGEPATFPVSGVIKGWQEILPMMPVGSKYKIYVPSDLAYGQRGAGQDIGPNEALIFEIELLKIVE